MQSTKHDWFKGVSSERTEAMLRENSSAWESVTAHSCGDIGMVAGMD